MMTRTYLVGLVICLSGLGISTMIVELLTRETTTETTTVTSPVYRSESMWQSEVADDLVVINRMPVFEPDDDEFVIPERPLVPDDQKLLAWSSFARLVKLERTADGSIWIGFEDVLMELTPHDLDQGVAISFSGQVTTITRFKDIDDE